MAVKFTEGKWALDGDGTGIYSLTEDCYVVDNLAPANSDEQVEANARLIAAAPEMYELLKFYIYKCEHEEYTPIYKEAVELFNRIDGEKYE